MSKGQQKRYSNRKIQCFKGHKLIKEYKTIKDAANELGLNSSGICIVLKNPKRSCGGFKWEYIHT